MDKRSFSDKVADMWTSFLLTTRIRRIDFTMETVPSKGRCCEPAQLNIVAEYKWFWEKSNPSACSSSGCRCC